MWVAGLQSLARLDTTQPWPSGYGPMPKPTWDFAGEYNDAQDDAALNEMGAKGPPRSREDQSKDESSSEEQEPEKEQIMKAGEDHHFTADTLEYNHAPAAPIHSALAVTPPPVYGGVRDRINILEAPILLPLEEDPDGVADAIDTADATLDME